MQNDIDQQKKGIEKTSFYLMTGVNEISNLKDSYTLLENTSVLQTKNKDLVEIAEQMASDSKRVILLTRVPRLDCKQELNTLMD